MESGGGARQLVQKFNKDKEYRFIKSFLNVVALHIGSMSAVLGCSGHTAAAARLGNLQNVSRVQEASLTSIYLYLPVSTNQFGNEEKPRYLQNTA